MTRARTLASTLLAAVVLLGVLPFAPPASAASTYLCTGYVPCAEDGYSHAGYKSNSKKMWWRMYTGHNCTNYVAYRLVKNGMSSVRPWEGSGNASNWGKAMKSITNQTPMVGSVAWWAAGDGVGSSGHVAYVEEVVSSTQIVISEDSWSGDFHWRRISKSSSSWPTGFIHFDDRAVENTARPAVGATPAVGKPLTATLGKWAPASAYSVQWLADGKAIAGATSGTLTPTVAMLGKELQVRVAATKRGYVSGSSLSLRSAEVAPGTLTRAAAPTISGTARVDEVLTIEQPAAWTPAPASTTTRWYADGQPISGATRTSLRLGQDLYRKVITVRTTARRDGYKTAVAASAPTAAVAAGNIDVTTPYTLSGEARLGKRLTLKEGAVDPADSAVTYTWLRNGHAIPGAKGLTYDLSTADVGRRITVRVGLRHQGYLDRVVTLDTGGVVTTVPSLKVTATGKRGRAVVSLRVTAPGVAAPGGRATVTIAGREVSGRVVDGRLKVIVEDLKPGTRAVKVAYDGTESILAGRARTTVRVLS